MKEKKKKWNNGSLTVEAAGVMPVVLVVTLVMIYLCLFFHNRAWLTAAACEAALTGSIEGCREEGNAYEAASAKSLELAGTGFFGVGSLSTSTAVDTFVRVSYQVDSPVLPGGFRMGFRAEGNAVKLCPSEAIRRKHAGKQ